MYATPYERTNIAFSTDCLYLFIHLFAQIFGRILVEMQTVAHQFRIRHVYQICVLIFFSKTFHGGFHFAAILFVLLGYRTENKGRLE